MCPAHQTGLWKSEGNKIQQARPETLTFFLLLVNTCSQTMLGFFLIIRISALTETDFQEKMAGLMACGKAHAQEFVPAACYR